MDKDYDEIVYDYAEEWHDENDYKDYDEIVYDYAEAWHEENDYKVYEDQTDPKQIKEWLLKKEEIRSLSEDDIDDLADNVAWQTATWLDDAGCIHYDAITNFISNY